MKVRGHFVVWTSMLVGGGAIVFMIWAYAGKRRAESLNCASSIVSVCFAGRMWAQDHDGNFPTNFISMSHEVNTPKILCCVPERRVGTWSEFGPENCTYEIVTPGVHEAAKDTIFVRCKIHGHLGYPDTTVFDGVRRRGKFE